MLSGGCRSTFRTRGGRTSQSGDTSANWRHFVDCQPFRELTSARGHALLQLSKPVLDYADLRDRRRLLVVLDEDEPLAIGGDAVERGGPRRLHVVAFKQ